MMSTLLEFGKNMRDSIKDKCYFDDFIKEDSERISAFVEKLKNGQIPYARVQRIKEKTTALQLGVFIARYSRGDELIELSKSFSPLFDSWTGTFNKNNYDVNLKMVSLSVLFNFEKELSKIENNLLEIDDWLTTYLLCGENNKTLVYPEHYENLRSILKNNSFDSLLSYAKNDWFDEELDCFFSHKSSENLYYGYWCFEVAAIIKKLQIADRKLANAKFYPYDLAHFQE